MTTSCRNIWQQFVEASIPYDITLKSVVHDEREDIKKEMLVGIFFFEHQKSRAIIILNNGFYPTSDSSTCLGNNIVADIRHCLVEHMRGGLSFFGVPQSWNFVQKPVMKKVGCFFFLIFIALTFLSWLEEGSRYLLYPIDAVRTHIVTVFAVLIVYTWSHGWLTRNSIFADLCWCWQSSFCTDML